MKICGSNILLISKKTFCNRLFLFRYYHSYPENPADLFRILFVYSKFLATIFQEANNLLSGSNTGIDICFGSLSTHLLRS